MGTNGQHPEQSVLSPPATGTELVVRAPRYGPPAGADMLDLRGFLGVLRRAKAGAKQLFIAGIEKAGLLAN